MNVDLASPDLTDAIWQHISEGMIKSCEGTNITAGHLWQECRSGRAFLLVAWDEQQILGAAVVQFQDKGLRGLGFTGNRVDEWFPQLKAEVVSLMRSGGVTQFIDSGRPGMMRKYFPDAKIVGTTYEVMTHEQ